MNVTNNLNINWDKVHPKFKFAAMDEDESVMLFAECPKIEDPKYSLDGRWVITIPTWAICYTRDGNSILKEPVPWSQTLTARPVKVK